MTSSELALQVHHELSRLPQTTLNQLMRAPRARQCARALILCEQTEKAAKSLSGTHQKLLNLNCAHF